MTKVISNAGHSAGPSAQAHIALSRNVLPADPPRDVDSRAIDLLIDELRVRLIQKRAARAQAAAVDRQAAIENALTMALQHVRLPGDNLRAATVNTRRALTLLKHECQESGSIGFNAPRSAVTAVCNQRG